jgi:ABC-2 type transport system permease protein
MKNEFYLYFSGDNIYSVKKALVVDSAGLIYQNFAIETITFLSLIYFIYCAASSIINDQKNGVFIYSFVKNIPLRKILARKIVMAYAFVISSNLFVILLTSIISLLIYGGQKEMIINAFILLLTKSYTAIFYVTLALFFAFFVRNYVFVLSILFIVEMAKFGIYVLLNDFSFSKFIILNHIDISYFFDLPSTGVDRGYSLPFTILIYVIYIAVFQLLTYYIFTKKRERLI